jgi:hypothetical protein
VGSLDLYATGRVVRIVRLKDEFYVSPPNPSEFVSRMKTAGVRADLYSFVQDLNEPMPKFGYCRGAEPMAVLPLTTFDNWLNRQIRAKSRNMLHKAAKCGVQTRVVELSEDLLRGIKAIYDETPVRQGKRNRHYGKDIDTLRVEHATFLDRSEFVGAFHGDELIGFAKVAHAPHCSIIMNLVSKLAHRDKATSNALIAKVIEQVTNRQIGLLNYAVWGRRGMNAFKVASAFERCDIPRYYVPLNMRGRVFIALGLHRSLKERLPEEWLVRAADWRDRWTLWRVRASSVPASAAEPAAEEAARPRGGVPTSASKNP